MALTRLGWDVLTSGSSSRLEPLQWITGKVRAGDAHTILDELGRRFNAEVEPIIKAHSWGWANRPVRGYLLVKSEHSAGVAVDFNAPAHWLGARGTFTAAQVRAIRKILADLDGSVRWGGDWARPDEMHFELQGGVAKLAKVAAKIRAGDVKPVAAEPKPKPVVKPSPKADRAAKRDYKPGEVADIQRALNYAGYDAGPEDDDYGPRVERAVIAYQKAQVFPSGKAALLPDGDWGPVVRKHWQWVKLLQRNLNMWAGADIRVDGDYRYVTRERVREVMERNRGHAYKGRVDAIPGPVFCKMLTIPVHP